jgi:DNA-binding NtrC family response regulator
MTEMNTYDWPRNIRQLHNVVARLCARSDGPSITCGVVRKELLRFGHVPKNDGGILLPPDCRMLFPGESIHQFNRRVKRRLIETVRSEWIDQRFQSSTRA